MKKIILIIVLFFNLIPVLKEGKIEIIGSFEALASEENGSEENNGCVVSSSDETLRSSSETLDVYEITFYLGNCVTQEPSGESFTCYRTVEKEPGQSDNGDHYGQYYYGGSWHDEPEPSNTSYCEEFFGYGYFESDCGCVTDYSECNTQDPVPDQDPDPCDTTSQNASTKVSEIADDTIIDSRLDNLANGLTPTETGQAEKGFPIYQNDSTDVYSYGLYQTAPSANLSLQISTTVYPNEPCVASAHTHPAEAFPAPSAVDIYGLIGLNASINTAETAFIIAADGSRYALHIDDPSKVADFLIANPKGTSLDDSEFSSNSDIGKEFNKIESSFIAQGYSPKEAFERATATVLQDSGISLLKASPNTGTFKKIDTKQVKDANGNPVKDGHGNNKYVKVDC